jgi:putative ABC transport system substrate-binding protein
LEEGDAMNRRDTLFAMLALGMTPFASEAQQPAKPARIAVLGFGSPDTTGFLLDAFKLGMNDQGYIEGKDFVMVIRWALGKSERLPDLAKELVALQPDIILTAASDVTQIAQKTTSTIPIVMIATADPVENGLVNSLARPGGNITGLSILSTDLGPKLAEMLKSAVPKLSRVAVLWNPSVPSNAAALKNVQTAAQGMRLSILPVEATTPAEIESAFARMTHEHAGAVIIVASRFAFQHTRQIAELALKHRLPSSFPYPEAGAAGGLMSYGNGVASQFRQVAKHVDKILKGAKPADLPVEQPTIFELTINLRTAKALGVKIPQSLLLSATKVIE